MAQERTKPVDVAVVGAGVSGLYGAWRLKEAHPDWRIVVYESSDYRTGGRLMSAIPPEMPHVPAELGGMRFLNTQPIVAALAKHLKLTILDFPVSEANNIAYLRGRWLRRSDLTDPAKVPYALGTQERGQPIGAIMEAAMETIVPGITAPSLTPQQRRELAQATTFLGRPLYEWGFWNVLARVMSFEAYQFVADASGYDTTVSNWNAADAIPWFLEDFGTNVKYVFPTTGMQSFPHGIEASFKTIQGEVLLNHTVTSVSRQGEKLRLHFNARDYVDADRVILAMPRRSLELIDLDAAFGAAMPRVRVLIESVSPQPLFKLFACYRVPWWRHALLNVKQGQTTTDVPIRQTYYFRTEGEQPGADPKNTNSLLMATYDDGRNIRYWIGFLREAERAERFADGAAGQGDEQWQRNRPTPAMVEEIHRLVAQVHGLAPDAVPKPYAAAFYDWGTDPFGGGYNLWKIHARSADVAREIVQPDAALPLYVCGEAYSHAQGWVEGALETAEDMLQRCFGLGPPSWLHPSRTAQKGETTTESATLRF
ncbi:MAG: FAD-dependent oxidoreductase [Candidatus Eremiobacteraeota bacterium]|nr:FAD-dependent oxidoreductase [Candidatus Eremiobacteraeota bacterium]